jgi:hypothetical protein
MHISYLLFYPSQSSEAFTEKQNYFCLELLKDDKDKDKKRAVTQAAFKRKFKKNSDFWVYEKKVRLIVRKVREYLCNSLGNKLSKTLEMVFSKAELKVETLQCKKVFYKFA